MKLGHEEIKNRLPDYSSGTLPEREKNEISSHLNDCPDCRAELSLIDELRKIEVPDPGNFFWQNLPSKVSIFSKERKNKFSWSRLFPKPVFVAASIILIIAAVLIFSKNRQEFSENYSDPLFSDPLSAPVVDYSLLEDEDMSEAVENIILDEDDLSVVPGIPYESSYQEDLAYLSSDDANLLSGKLKLTLQSSPVL